MIMERKPRTPQGSIIWTPYLKKRECGRSVSCWPTLLSYRKVSSQDQVTQTHPPCFFKMLIFGTHFNTYQHAYLGNIFRRKLSWQVCGKHKLPKLTPSRFFNMFIFDKLKAGNIFGKKLSQQVMWCLIFEPHIAFASCKCKCSAKTNKNWNRIF